jgi:hypothetical protein
MRILVILHRHVRLFGIGGAVELDAYYQEMVVLSSFTHLFPDRNIFQLIVASLKTHFVGTSGGIKESADTQEYMQSNYEIKHMQ